MRNETFDPADVLLATLVSFWRRGFESTNMLQLLDAMSLDSKAFYKVFESKREVFLKCLDLYFSNIDADLTRLISESRDSDSAVAVLVDSILAAAKSPAFATIEWRGCLIGNTALEFCARDQEIVDRLKAGILVLRTQFKKALSLPSANGTKPSENEIDRSALHLIVGIQGLLVLAKSGLSEADIEVVRSAILASAVRSRNVATRSPRSRTREGR